jgi:hypothetical protein
MIVNVYAMRDLKSNFMSPTVSVNDAVAMRSFESAIESSNNELFTHRNDFQLYRIGTYDMDKGQLIPEDLPVLVCEGKDVVG